MSPKKIAFVSLGCDKNKVDSEYMLGALEAAGHRIVQDTAGADAIVVNTCAFLEASRAEAIDTILSLAKDKRAGQKLIAAGCLPERYIGEIRDALPEVDGFLGVEAREELLEMLEALEDGERKDFVMDAPHGERFEGHARVLTTPQNVAYLKIADGCDNRCTYCLIPSIRGRYRSVPEADLLKEAEALVSEGVTELVLVAQDLTGYGKDFGTRGLVRLIRELSKLDLVWIRLLYCYPESVTDELIAELRDNHKLAKYIDVPLQHVSDSVLRRMGRKGRRAQIEALIEKLRREVPSVTIRSTFIVGFPGETEAEFEELLHFLKGARLDHTGFFAYSDEEDAPSFKLPNKVEEEVKEARLLRAMETASRIQREKLDGMVGRTVRAVCDGVDFDEGVFVGRTEGQAPEVDTRLRLSGDCEIESGRYYDVQITGREKEDLNAKILRVAL